MIVTKHSFKMVWKYVVCSVLFSIQASGSELITGIQYEQVNNEEFVGRLWLPDTSNKAPAILLIGGSGGEFENQDAQWLSSAGFVVLNIRYFGAKGLPSDLVNIPIEYFNSAIVWLNNNPHVMKDCIGLFGHSKGTEAAILTAYYNPLVKAIVARSPSSIVWAGPGWSGLNESSWSWNNNPLDFHSVGLIDGAIWLSRVLRGKKLIETRDMFDNVLGDEESVNKAMLPVEHMNAHLLLLSGKGDKQWPSTKMADMLVSILDKSNIDFSYDHFAFDNAGHRPARLSKPDDIFANGGTVQGNAEAHKRTKVLVKEFFDKNLQ
ncbi:hypothetical protein CWB96_01365 [Pseudoalteromonas citrea]|uniref:BAAT/Acyl-CoA thioester hydrolase C-terminal domain-containing protein n=1 Tax=Pseudoalteromonas citrea TaxID=43655 RepID=A0A5S3XUC6_9GAMM|nr:acyl-CoA thioester hydrolase/BAAT C-terminal domain-containing protein [Pseudoalteromonas citrea]TMP42202.1 hypothetical protein CWB97_12700 [Pseudoalteromonas citrea]TMP62328.1 hypothetical protein CWB96_01365 [Pseudoalteromonas citrea]